jgi:hypothetical protein
MINAYDTVAAATGAHSVSHFCFILKGHFTVFNWMKPSVLDHVERQNENKKIIIKKRLKNLEI